MSEPSQIPVVVEAIKTRAMTHRTTDTFHTMQNTCGRIQANGLSMPKQKRTIDRFGRCRESRRFARDLVRSAVNVSHPLLYCGLTAFVSCYAV